MFFLRFSSSRAFNGSSAAQYLSADIFCKKVLNLFSGDLLHNVISKLIGIDRSEVFP